MKTYLHKVSLTLQKFLQLLLFPKSGPSSQERRVHMAGMSNEEVKYLYNVQAPKKVEGKISVHEDKIHTSLSVAKLALLIRLLLIDKIIINRTVAPTLRIAAKIFTTLQKDEISFGSLETK